MKSLVMPKCSGIPVAEFDVSNSEHRWVRLYVGLEEADYLVTDLEQTLLKIA